MAGQFGDIKSFFEIEVSVLKYPVFLVGWWKPGFCSFIIHGNKGFGDNEIRGGRGGDLGGESCIMWS